MEVLFKIAPNATIRGTVLDEGNEAVRQAQVSVYVIPRDTVEGDQTAAVRAGAMTDDRGHYEIADLAPGDYRLSVQARPWYASGAQPRGMIGGAAHTDPALDVVYPVTWFPGAIDEAAASTITVQPGEVREASVQLNPMPSIHVRMPPPLVTASADPAKRNIRYPQIQRISSGGNFNPTSVTTDANGQVEFGGLAPGLYRIQ